MTERIACDKFVYGREASTLGQRWENWLEKFDLFLVANAITSEEKKKASLLLLMGNEAYDVYKIKRKASKDDKFEEIKTFMTAHFQVKRCEYTEVMGFRRALRHDDESVNDYAMRLRSAAAHCKFSDIDKEIERQFVAGCRMHDLERKVCTSTEGITLQKVLDWATALESCEANVNGLHEPVERINEISEDTVSHPKERRSGYQSKASQSGGYYPRGRDGISRGKSSDQGQAETKQVSFDEGADEGQVRHIEASTDCGSYMLSMEEYAEFLRYKEHTEWLGALKEENMVKRIQRWPRVQFRLGVNQVEFLVDTGSPINVIDEATYESLWERPELEICNKKYYGYTSKVPIEIRGQFDIEVEVQGVRVPATFIVVKGQEESLLSYRTAVATGLVKVVEAGKVYEWAVELAGATQAESGSRDWSDRIRARELQIRSTGKVLTELQERESVSSGDAESQYLVSVKKDSMVTAVGDGHRTTWELKIDGDKQYPVVSDARGIPFEASTRADLVETANHASVQDTEDAVVSKGGGAERMEPASENGVATGTVVVPPTPRVKLKDKWSKEEQGEIATRFLYQRRTKDAGRW